MRKLICTLCATGFVIAFAATNVNAQQLTWTTKSKKTLELAKQGATHYLNLENELAYEDFSKALENDPDFTVAQVFLATMAVGDAKKIYADKARNSVKNKSDGEKMLVTILDAKSRKEGHDIWAGLYTNFPDDAMCHYFYIITMSDSIQAFNALTEYLQKYPSSPEAINNLAYLYILDKKDTATAKTYFEKYIEVYPGGYNPYDSMGEFYYMTGDMENSKKYYTKSLEHYPFCYSSRQKLEELNKKK